MAERRIINGYIVERQDDGSLVTIGPAATAPQMPVDPVFAYKGPQANADLKGQTTKNAIEEATAPATITKAQNDAVGSALELRTKGLPSGFQWGPDGRAMPIPGYVDPKQAADDRDRGGRLDSLIGQINRVTDLYNGSVGQTKGVFGAQDYLPTDANAAFDTAGANLSQQGLAAFRTPGTGTVSDRDAIMFDRANLPTASTRDAAIEEQLRGLRGRVDAERKSLGLPPVDWTMPEAAGKAQQENTAAAALITGAAAGGSMPPGVPPVAPGGGGTINGAPGGGGGPVITPNDQAYAAELQQVYNRGGSVPDMIAVAQKYGFDPRAQPVVEWQNAIDYREGTGAYKGRPRGLAQVQTPASGQRSLVQNTIGNTALTPVGAAALASADAGTFGLTDEIAGAVNSGGPGGYAAQRDYFDAGKRVAAEQSPTASAIGQIAGGLAGGMGIESLAAGGLTRLGRAGAILRGGLANPVVGNAVDGALYGAATGAGQQNNARLSNAVKGAGVGAAGSVLGAGVVAGTGRALIGVSNAAVQRLNDRGIAMMPGQILGQSGFIGRNLKNLEDAAESLPGLGSIIKQRRENSVEGLNRAGFREALAPINESVKNIAEEGVEEADDAVSRGYHRALNGVRAQPDQPFISDFGQAVQAGQAPGKYADDFNTIMQGEIGPVFKPGQQAFTGDDMQNLLRIAKGYARQYRKLGMEGSNGVPQPSARPVGQAFQDMVGATEGLLNRQAPDVLPAYNAANDAYRNVGVLRDAVDMAKNNGGKWSAAQLTRAASKNARKYGGTQGTTKQPFYQLTRDAQEILPSELPNSGTFDRQIAAGLMGVPVLGAGLAAQQGWIDPETALGIASLSAAYSKPGNALLQKALVSRPAAVRNAGQAVINRRRLGGLFGSSLGLTFAAP